ncbi:MAG: hypothetical protein M3O36_14895 [Myxococcota bacterium]|nr:hypothetical protein [Myxococcota bacterium]
MEGSCRADGGVDALARDATTADAPTDARGSELSYALLDPMTSATTVLGTYWYAVSDRTCPYACPAVFVANQPGTLSPADGQVFLPTARGDGPMIDGAVWPYREVTGGGETSWGVSVGFNLQDVPGASPIAKCGAPSCTSGVGDAAVSDAAEPVDANDVEAASVVAGPPAISCKDGTYAFNPVPYDASAHVGIAFWGRAPDPAATPPIVEVFISDRESSPVGGVCNPCLAGGTGACNDNFGFPVVPELTPQWQRYVVLFSRLSKGGWSGLKGAFDSTSIVGITFGLQTLRNGAPLPPFRIQIAYLQWVN